MKCLICGYEHLDIHNTESAYVTYCQQCGTTTEAKRAHPRRVAEIRKLPANRNSASNLVPVIEKQKKRRYG